MGECGGVRGGSVSWGLLELMLGKMGWQWCALVGVRGIVLRGWVLVLV